MQPSDASRLAKEIYLTAAAPALVKEVALILRPFDIPVMPLKGALLQRLVYKTSSFRPIRDVDLLVPPLQFTRAYEILRAAGFSNASEEPGLWQVTLRRPHGLLALDLHRRLSATMRSRLEPDAMFLRGRPDAELFDAPVVLPDPYDLYAHVLLHLTVDWVNYGTLHHPADLEAVPAALGLVPATLAQRLAVLGLTAHASLILPLTAARLQGDFTPRLLAELRVDRASRVLVNVSRRLSARFAAGTLARRGIGWLLAPSWVDASREALLRRLRG